MDALWLIHILLFIMVSSLLFYNVRSVEAKTYKWFKQGLVSIAIITAYCPLSILFLLQQLYADVNQTSLRDEWKERLVSATVFFVCLFLITLAANIVMAKRAPDYKWRREGLSSAAILTLCYFFITGTFIRTH